MEAQASAPLPVSNILGKPSPPTRRSPRASRINSRFAQALTPAGRASAFGVYPNPMSGLILGSWQDGSARDAFHGVVGELFVYRRALTATEIATLENYLRARWGTP